MRYGLLLFSVLVAFAEPFFGQRNPPGTQCPGTEVIASTDRVLDGETASFNFEITGGNVDRSLLTYHWSIDRGRIAGGQGTAVVLVDTTGQGPAGSVTATMSVGGAYPECEWMTSDSVWVRHKGQLTKADLFWEWFVDNGGDLYHYGPQYQEYPGEALLEMPQRVRDVDRDLTFRILAKDEKTAERTIVFGYSGKTDKSKIVDDLIARAPMISYFKFVAERPR